MYLNNQMFLWAFSCDFESDNITLVIYIREMDNRTATVTAPLIVIYNNTFNVWWKYGDVRFYIIWSRISGDKVI